MEPVIVGLILAVVGILNLYLLHIVKNIESSLKGKVDSEHLKENLSLKDKMLDANILALNTKIDKAIGDVDQFAETVDELKDVVSKFCEEVIQVRGRVDKFMIVIKKILDESLAKIDRDRPSP